MEDITEEDKNYVEYQTFPSLKWHPAMYEQSVVDQLMQSMFHTFVDKGKRSRTSIFAERETGVVGMG
jgi:hypothetical protein